VGFGLCCLFGEPYLLIRTTQVEERVFESVEEDFALVEGQSSIQGWRKSRIKSWNGKKDPDGVAFGDGTGKTMLFEKFETLWPTLVEEFP
jgi:uncharacterized protein YhfF